MDSKSYKTRQRDALMDFFKENRDKCFLAKDIIKHSEVELGEATVYRCLNKFAEEGILKKFITPGSGGALYQYNDGCDKCKSHFHLKCVNCGVLVHMDCSFMDTMKSHIEAEHGFSVDNSITTLYGICRDCR